MIKTVKEIILDSIEPVINNLQYLQLVHDNIDKLIEDVKLTKPSDWSNDFILKDSTKNIANYFLVFTALSHYFWELPKWYKLYQNKKLGGSESLFFTITNAVKTGINLTDALVLQNIRFEEFKDIMKGEDGVELSNLKQRFRILQNIGKVLNDRYEGDIHNLFIEENYDVSRIVIRLATEFEGFNDSYYFRDKEIFLFKKAQEVITLLYESNTDSISDKFRGMAELTASSDYKLPQLLSSYGILKYCNGLELKINNTNKLMDGDREVVEIRCATIQAVEMIRLKLKRTNINLESFEISNLLWTLSQNNNKSLIPYPRIVSNVV